MSNDFPGLTPAEREELKRLLAANDKNNQAFKARLVALLEKQKGTKCKP